MPNNEPAAPGMNLCQNLVPRVCLPCTLPVGHKGLCSPEITATEPAAVQLSEVNAELRNEIAALRAALESYRGF